MPESRFNLQERPLYLTKEEALALLDVCLLSSVEDDPIKERAVIRLSSVCREFIREDADSHQNACRPERSCSAFAAAA